MPNLQQFLNDEKAIIFINTQVQQLVNAILRDNGVKFELGDRLHIEINFSIVNVKSQLQ